MPASDTAIWSADDATLHDPDRTVSPDALAALVGQPFGTSDWITVTQDMVNAFADATGDYQFIHVDPVRAADTPFGGTVAHGFLTLSLLPQLMASSDCPRMGGVAMGVNYGCDRLRFVAPVRVGARVRGVFALVDFVQKHPGVFQQTIDATVEIAGEEKPALVARWISQFHTVDAPVPDDEIDELGPPPADTPPGGAPSASLSPSPAEQGSDPHA